MTPNLGLRLAIAGLVLGSTACPVPIERLPSIEIHDADPGDEVDGGIDARTDVGQIPDASGEPSDLGTYDADAETAPEDVGVPMPTFDCGACAEQTSNRACVDNDTSCGCLHDQHCSGAEICDRNLGRCVTCDDSTCWRSLLYPADWTPQSVDAEGRFLHDFSHAGYGAGIEPIPSPSAPIFDVSTYGSGPNWQEAIQLAIDSAVQADGGIVYLPPGSYRVDGRLLIHGSGVVLRGAGAANTQLYFSTSGDMTDLAHIEIGRAPGYGPPELLSVDAANRSTVVEVSDSTQFDPGDRVAVGWLISDAFRGDHGMSEYWSFAAGQWRPFFRRTIVEIDRTNPGAHRIYLDVPIRYPALTRDAASIRPIETWIQDVGIEDLSLSNAVLLDDARAEDRASLIAFSGVEDGWARRIQTFSSPLSGPGSDIFHVQSHGISVINSRRVTLEDVSIGRAQNRGSGGNGYLIEISRSNEVLVQRAIVREGRHNFSFNWDFGNSGIVIRDSDSSGSACDGAFVACRNEFHHSLAMAVLVEDSRISDGWVGGNRRAESSGAGHTVTQSVYWRLYGGDRIYSWQYGHGYLIGNDIPEQYTELADTSQPSWELQWLPFWALSSNSHTSLDTEPEDFVEGAGRRDQLVPASLYRDQLERRRSALGSN